MQYLVLAYDGGAQSSELSASERRIIAEASHENDLDLRENGFLVLGISVESGTSTGTVSICDGDVRIDEAATSLSGLYVLHAKDLNDAIRTVSTMPQTRLGRMEIRPVVNMDTK